MVFVLLSKKRRVELFRSKIHPVSSWRVPFCFKSMLKGGKATGGES